MSKRSRLNYLHSISHNVERKKMYKAKKQWVVAGLSFLVATGVGLVSGKLSTHASTATPQTTKPVKQYLNQKNNLSNNKQVLRNNSTQNQNKQLNSNVVKPTNNVRANVNHTVQSSASALHQTLIKHGLNKLASVQSNTPQQSQANQKVNHQQPHQILYNTNSVNQNSGATHTHVNRNNGSTQNNQNISTNSNNHENKNVVAPHINQNSKSKAIKESVNNPQLKLGLNKSHPLSMRHHHGHKEVNVNISYSDVSDGNQSVGMSSVKGHPGDQITSDSFSIPSGYVEDGPQYIQVPSSDNQTYVIRVKKDPNASTPTSDNGGYFNNNTPNNGSDNSGNSSSNNSTNTTSVFVNYLDNGQKLSGPDGTAYLTGTAGSMIPLSDYKLPDGYALASDPTNYFPASDNYSLSSPSINVNVTPSGPQSSQITLHVKYMIRGTSDVVGTQDLTANSSDRGQAVGSYLFTPPAGYTFPSNANDTLDQTYPSGNEATSYIDVIKSSSDNTGGYTPTPTPTPTPSTNPSGSTSDNNNNFSLSDTDTLNFYDDGSLVSTATVTGSPASASAATPPSGYYFSSDFGATSNSDAFDFDGGSHNFQVAPDSASGIQDYDTLFFSDNGSQVGSSEVSGNSGEFSFATAPSGYQLNSDTFGGFTFDNGNHNFGVESDTAASNTSESQSIANSQFDSASTSASLSESSASASISASASASVSAIASESASNSTSVSASLSASSSASASLSASQSASASSSTSASISASQSASESASQNSANESTANSESEQQASSNNNSDTTPSSSSTSDSGVEVSPANNSDLSGVVNSGNSTLSSISDSADSAISNSDSNGVVEAPQDSSDVTTKKSKSNNSSDSNSDTNPYSDYSDEGTGYSNYYPNYKSDEGSDYDYSSPERHHRHSHHRYHGGRITRTRAGAKYLKVSHAKRYYKHLTKVGRSKKSGTLHKGRKVRLIHAYKVRGRHHKYLRYEVKVGGHRYYISSKGVHKINKDRKGHHHARHHKHHEHHMHHRHHK